MLNDMRRRKFEVVVIWKLDRLARSLKQLLTIGEECRSQGVDLVSLRQNIDTTLPAGRLTFQILGAVVEFERELLRERVKAGMAQARKIGKHVGRPALRRFPSDDIERMRELRSQGTSVAKLAKDFETTQWMVARIEPEVHFRRREFEDLTVPRVDRVLTVGLSSTPGDWYEWTHDWFDHCNSRSRDDDCASLFGGQSGQSRRCY
jgi:DNA invertase Pin-like site-specific DNA recombinase